MLVVQALLTVCQLVVVVWTLHMLMRIDFATITDARRVRFAKALGDTISVEGLPARTQQDVMKGDALFLFVSEGCPCDVALVATASLARAHTDTTFIVWANEPWPELLAMQSSRLHVIDDAAFHDQFDVVMYPYFLKARQGTVIEFGVANLPEQVEAILAAGGTA